MPSPSKALAVLASLPTITGSSALAGERPGFGEIARLLSRIREAGRSR